MISLIRRVIRTELPDYAGSADTLSFLKYSTPNSGKDPDDKVIFLAFREDTTEPSLCVKTVRSYGARGTVIRNYDNLKRFNQLTVGSPYANLFARALFLFDDGEQVFSIETVCRGRKMKFDADVLRRVVETYTGFHALLAKRAPCVPLRQFAHDAISASGLGGAEQADLLHFIESLSGLSATLPRVIQHGDLTEDNILVSGDSLCIVDCDFAGVTDLPGFDLFGLFYRYDRKKARGQSMTHLPGYFARVGADVREEAYETLFFLYYLIERFRKSAGGKGQSTARLISDFKRLFV